MNDKQSKKRSVDWGMETRIAITLLLYEYITRVTSLLRRADQRQNTCRGLNDQTLAKKAVRLINMINESHKETYAI